MNKTFEDAYDEICEIIAKKRKKWVLNYMGHIDNSDIKQKILIHIHKKWHKYDQTKSLTPWLNKVINNQLQNIYRNEYGIYAKPCAECPNNEGDDLCSITKSGRQCSECPLYAEWVVKKQIGHEINVPQEYQESLHESEGEANNLHDFFFLANKIHDQIFEHLSDDDQKIYQLLFIESLPHKEIRDRMNFKKTKAALDYIKKAEVRLSDFVYKLYKEGEIDI